MKFSPHGNAQISWQDKILLVKLHGCFNGEGVVEYSKTLETAIAHKPADKWCRIDVIESESTLCTPDAYRQFLEEIRLCKQQGCQRMALIGGNSPIRGQFSSAARQIGIPLDNYSAKAEAIAALTDYLLEQNN